MRYTIENESMKVEVESYGAELKSLYGKETGIEYMWCANPEYYGRTAPNLFPFAGTLKNGEYTYKNQTYKMKSHGFARDMEWAVKKESDTQLTCTLVSDEKTRQKYPFDYTLTLIYTIAGRRLKITWKVQNDSNETMYFSLGFHPCFSCPVHGEDSKEGYSVDLHMKENAVCRDVDFETGLAQGTTTELAVTDGAVRITKELFAGGSFIIEDNQTHKVSLKDRSGQDYLTVHFEAPLVVLWSYERKDSPFVAIEPWYGCCDFADASGRLEERKWGNEIGGNEEFSCMYEIEIA